MKSKYKQIVFEGVTSTGKSTVGKLLIEMLGKGWEYDKSVLSDTERGREARGAMEKGVDSLTNNSMWLWDVLSHETELKATLDRTNLVRDRSYGSFFSFTRCYDGISDEDREYFLSFEEIAERTSPVADLVVLFRADKKDIISRMREKDDVTEMDIELAEKGILDMIESDMMEKISRSGENFIVVNTSEYESAKDVACAIYDFLQGAFYDS